MRYWFSPVLWKMVLIGFGLLVSIQCTPEQSLSFPEDVVVDSLNGENDEAALMMRDPVPADQIPPAPVLSPQEALADLEVEEDFTVELVAAEPLIEDPVALAFDGNGAIWVVEMRGYMGDLDGKGEEDPVGRIVVLQDLDGDGFFEHAIPFLEGLVMPRAISIVEGGILYAEPPNLFFVENHDYKAGKRVLVDSTYAVGGNVEHQPNGLVTALDNWIYNAKSDRRYRKVEGEWTWEDTEYRGQWGISQDDYGRLFYNHNSQVLLGDSFMPNAFQTNPHHWAQSEGRYGTPIGDNATYPRRITPGVNRAYRGEIIDSTGKLVRLTSASGPTVYRGNQFPHSHRGNAFVPEPAGNLMKRVLVEEKDGSVDARAPYDGRDFLTSTDERFRPVSVYTAPDGSLYVVDFYRGVIQHKTYLSDYLKRQIRQRNLDQPIGLGRIYRIRNNVQPLGTSPRLNEASSTSLVEVLDHENGWWRDTAQRLLVERQDQQIVPDLRAVLRDASHPLGQVHALWTLEGLGVLSLGDLDAAVSSDHVKLRTMAMRLCARWATSDEALRAFAILTTGGVQQVRESDLQLALSLSAFHDHHSASTFPILAELMAHYETDPVMLDAILSGLEDHEGDFIAFLEAEQQIVPSPYQDALASADINAKTQPARDLNLLTSEEQAQADRGASMYAHYCASCHGNNGEGIQAMAPPLNRSSWVLQDQQTLIRIVLDGMTGPVSVDGVNYAPPAVMPIMPGLRQNPDLADAQLADLLTHVRHAWDNRATAVDAETVEAVRQATAQRNGNPWTVEELRLQQEGEWTSLFDGTSLQGWKQLGGTASYEVVDGMLVGTAVPDTPNSFLVTEQHYGDFILELEFQVDSLLNSGIQIRSNTYSDYLDGRVHGYQVEIDPSARSWTGGIYDEGRRGWLNNLQANPQARQAFQFGNWNHFRIEARGSHIRTWINDVLAADLIDTRTESGFIGLQVHSVVNEPEKIGKQVRWRNLLIMDLGVSTLKASSDPVSHPISTARDGDPTTCWQATGADGWIELDLRESQDLGGVSLTFPSQVENDASIQVQLSADGANWRTVFEGQQGTGEYSWTKRPSRYLRIEGSQGNTLAVCEIQPL